MDKDFGSGWTEWGAVVIEGSMKLCLGREFWVDARAAKKVKCE